MKTITLTEEQFDEAANEISSIIAKDDPVFGVSLAMAYMLLKYKLFKCKDSDIESEEVEDEVDLNE